MTCFDTSTIAWSNIAGVLRPRQAPLGMVGSNYHVIVLKHHVTERHSSAPA